MEQEVERQPSLFAIILSLVLLVLFVVGCLEASKSYPSRWVDVLPDNPGKESNAQRITNVLTSAKAPVLIVNFIRNGGKPLRIWVIKGHLSKTVIEPQNQWKKLGSNLLLVNSVDEKADDVEEAQTQNAGLHAAVEAGCGLGSLPQSPIAAGNLSLQPCRGPFNNFGIKEVASFAVVVGRDVTSKVPCIEYAARGEQAEYQRCLAASASQSIRVLLGELFGARSTPYDGVILPGLGTGIGGLNAQAFYDPLFGEIVSDAKQAAGASELPPNIYLLVDNGLTLSEQMQFYQAIGAASSRLLDWEAAAHPPGSTETLTLTGVAGGTAAAIIVVVLIGRLRSSAPEIWLLASQPTLSLTIGWIATSLGVATAITPLIAVVPFKLLPWGQIAIGFLAAPAGPYLYRSLRAMEGKLK